MSTNTSQQVNWIGWKIWKSSNSYCIIVNNDFSGCLLDFYYTYNLSKTIELK